MLTIITNTISPFTGAALESPCQPNFIFVSQHQGNKIEDGEVDTNSGTCGSLKVQFVHKKICHLRPRTNTI